MLRPGADGVAPCNIAVAEWDELPPEPEASPFMAEMHTGLCQRCHVLMEQEYVRNEGGARGALVAKFGERNHMDPVWVFPHEELASLFQAASLTESMFVALEHMQVNFVTA